MDLEHVHQSKLFRGILIGIVATILILMVFKAGELVGYRKAAFSSHLGDNYYRAFEGGRPPMGGMLPGGHGAAGKIISINLPTFVVDGPDGIEKTVVIDDDTAIRRFRDTITADALRVDDFVTVLGEPDGEGHVTAKLIRVLPPPMTARPLPSGTGTTTP